ncbi:unnamed protein product, partial [Ectocarpus sp. 12 AP-2014]
CKTAFCRPKNRAMGQGGTAGEHKSKSDLLPPWTRNDQGGVKITRNNLLPPAPCCVFSVESNSQHESRLPSVDIVRFTDLLGKCLHTFSHQSRLFYRYNHANS